MSKYRNTEEKELVAKLEPIIKKMPYATADKLYDFLEELDTVKEALDDNPLDDFLRLYDEDRLNISKKVSLDDICEGLEFKESGILGDFLNETVEAIRKIDSAIFAILKISHAYDDLKDAAEERKDAPHILLSYDNYTNYCIHELNGEEARDFIQEAYKGKGEFIVTKLHFYADGRVRMETEHLAPIEYSAEDAKWIHEYVGMEK